MRTNLISPPQDETEQDSHFLSSLLSFLPPVVLLSAAHQSSYLTCIHIRFPRSARLCVHAHQAQMLIHGPLPQPAAHAAYRLTPASVFITAQRPSHPTHTWSLTCTLPYTPCSPPSPPAPSKQASVASCCCHRPPRLPPIASDIHGLVAFPVVLSRRSLFWFFYAEDWCLLFSIYFMGSGGGAV